MAYDRAGLTPILLTAQGTAMLLDAAATTEAAHSFTAPSSGYIFGALVEVTVTTAWDTTVPVFAGHVNDVEVGTMTGMADASAAELYSLTMTPASGQTGRFEKDDVLKFEVKTQAADGTATAGSGHVYLLVALDSVG